MFRRVLCILALISVLPVFAGVFENAMANNKKIFLYLYKPDCGYCVKFDSIYTKISIKYGNNCKFLKINTDTEYGGKLVQNYNVSYVPYVLLIDNNKHSMNRVTPKCLLNYACVNDALDKFIN